MHAINAHAHLRFHFRKTFPVVNDHQFKLLSVAVYPNGNVFCIGMFKNIINGLLEYSVDQQLTVLVCRCFWSL